MRKSRKLTSTVFTLTALGATASLLPARANILSDLRRSISSLWRQHGARQSSAKAAYQRAAVINTRADALYQKLEGTQRTLLESNEIYGNYLGQLRRTERQIVRLKGRITIVNERIDRRRALFGQRLAAMQRSGRTGYLGSFLESRSLSDLSWRNYVFQTITQRDAELQRGLKDDKALLLSMQNVLAQEWDKRRGFEAQARGERVRIASVMNQQHNVLQEMYNDRHAQLLYAQAQQTSSDEIADMIAHSSAKRDQVLDRLAQQESQERLQWRASQRAQRYARHSRGRTRLVVGRWRANSPQEIPPWSPIGARQIPEAETHEEGEDWSSAPVPGNGWVVPVRGRLSSRYGMRYHPILHRTKLHTGDDLAAAYGTPFRAARGGRVIYAGWKTAYGNTVIVDNGNGTSTLYGHASRLDVQTGQMVKQGQTIGNVGSTGFSTGPHLHFEVRKNGKPVDPTRYLHGG